MTIWNVDLAGTQFRDGRLLLSEAFKSRRIVQWFEPQGDEFHYKIVARGISGAILWQGNFDDLVAALTFWRALQDIGPSPDQWDMPTPAWHPGLSTGVLVYEFATVTQFTTIGTSTWTVPGGVIATDYLIVAGGGGGGSIGGGGGGAGGLLTGTTALSAGSFTVNVAGGGIAETNGANSVFSGFTAIGGGAGARNTFAGSTGGSGGGAGMSITGTTSGGSGTAGQGNSGGQSGAANQRVSGGGGGAGAVGNNASSPNSGNGGAGVSSSISGSPVTYAGGGGGGGDTNPSTNPGGGGSGGGGGGAVGAVNGGPGVANTGGGGGGGGNVNNGGSGNGGQGGSGIVVLSNSVQAIKPIRVRNFVERRQGFSY
jgi:hypothetical protein